MAKNDPKKIRPSRYDETPNQRRVAGDTQEMRKRRDAFRRGHSHQHISYEVVHGSGGGFKARLMRRLRGIPHQLSNDTTGGMLLIGAAFAAILIANSPIRHYYEAVSDYHFGPETLHLNLSVNHWVADGLLAIFFFVVGLELKTEFVTGALRDIREAALPMIAAAGGVIGPSLIYMFVQVSSGSPHYAGWAIPSATDIAFAVALLAVFGRGLPPAARTFLLTLAVVDDLLVIVIIAIFYSESIALPYLAISVLAIAVFGFLTYKRITKWWLLIPVALVAWWAMHASGIHATISAVALGLVVPAKRRGSEEQMTHRFVEMWNPISAGFAVPVFAFFAAGINVVDTGGLWEVVTDPVSVGIMIGLPLGKLLGIWGTVVVMTKFTPLRLGHGVDWQDIFAIALLAGIGFTVALLVAGLAFPVGSPEADHAAMGVILGTFIAAIGGAVALRRRVAVHARGRAARR